MFSLLSSPFAAQAQFMNTALEFGFRHRVKNRGDAGDSLVLKPLNVSNRKLVFRSLKDKKDSEADRRRATLWSCMFVRVAFFLASV